MPGGVFNIISTGYQRFQWIDVCLQLVGKTVRMGYRTFARCFLKTAKTKMYSHNSLYHNSLYMARACVCLRVFVEKKKKNYEIMKKMLEIKKINNLCLRMAAFAAVVLMCAAPAALKAQGTIGSSASNPFPIKTPGQLTSLAERVNAGGSFYFDPADSLYYADNGTGRVLIANKAQDAFFKLTADIELNTADVASSEGVGSFNVWTPIGNTNMHPFDGDFNGDNHLIIGAFVNQPGTDNAGVFGQTANHASIRHLGVVKSYICGKSDVGGIVGKAIGSRIDSCFFFGTVNANDAHVGGIVGMIASSTVVNNCYANAIVSATVSQLGGIVGCTDNAGDPCTISNCYSSSILRGYQRYTGGVLGEDKHSQTVLSNLFFDQQMINMLTAGISPNSIGGITGMNTTDMIDGTWAPTGFTASGAGFYPHITGFDVPSGSVGFLSLVPIILPAGATLSDLSSVSEITLGGGDAVTWAVVEIVGAASVDESTLTVNGQSFVNLSVTAGGVTRTYPFRFEKEPLIGTATNPFPINTLADLTAFRDGINTGAPFSYKHFTVPAFGENTCFLQTADITMPNNNWVSIGYKSAYPFKGTYDGGEHAVIGWKYSTSAEYAFFRYTDYATIKNLTVRNVQSAQNASLIYSMKGGLVDNCHAEGSTVTKGGLIWETPLGDYTATITNSTNKNKCTGLGIVGGIVSELGSVNNVIDNCHNFGDVTCITSWGGGIVGGDKFESGAVLTITNCSNRGTVSHTSSSKEKYLGGIVGHEPNCTISHCWNIGKVMGRCQYVAGILGYGTGNSTVEYCYNLGEVSTYPPTTGMVGVYVYGIAGNNAEVSHCFNAGKVINQSEKSTYAIASTNVDVCFNAGDIIGGTDGTSVFSTSTAHRDNRYSIGRLYGGGSSNLGACYVDTLRVPSTYTSATSTLKKSTSTLTGSVAPFSSNSTDWVCAAGTYPRIKGMEDLTISKVLALPIEFAGTDNVDNVTQNFRVRSQWGIEWEVEGANIGTPVDNYQTVTLPASRIGNIVLKAQYEDTCYYRIVLKMGVSAPTSALTVDNLTDLQNLRTGINSGTSFTYKGIAVPAGGAGTTFELTTNITLSSSSNWDPIGTETNPFKGIFDGKGDTISGMRQTNLSYSGLFGYVKNGTVKDLALTGINVNSPQQTGGICTYLQGGTISNCSVSGTLGYSSEVADAIKYRGGVVAVMSNGATVTNCYNEATITGAVSAYVGGIVGRALNNTCIIEKCINAGTIKNATFTGGISAYGGKILQCVNYGEIIGQARSTRVAGIVAYMRDCEVEGCINSGRISVPQTIGDCYVAGIAGSYSGTVKYCYNVGEVLGRNAAKTTGISSNACTQCYNAGKVTGDNAYAVTNGTATKCFYDSQLSVTLAGNGTAKTTAEMCGTSLSGTDGLGSSFVYSDKMYPRVAGIENIPASWATAAPVFLKEPETVSLVNNDFSMAGCNHADWSLESGTAVTIGACVSDTCTATINSPGIPVLCSSVDGVVYKKVKLNLRVDALIIKNATELSNFRDGINTGLAFFYDASDSTYHNSNNAQQSYISVSPGGEGFTFRLDADIDLGGNKWVNPIGNTSTKVFKGSFDGDGHTISNFKLNNVTHSGLFGYAENANIENLTLADVKSQARTDASSPALTQTYIGVLVGQFTVGTMKDITIRDCVVDGQGSYTGGLAGEMSQATLKNINMIRDTVRGNARVGGIAGNMVQSRIDSSHVNDCDITSLGGNAGGIAGFISSHSSYIYDSDVTNIKIKSSGGTVGGVGGSTSSMTIQRVHVIGGLIDADGCDVVGGVVGTGDCTSMSYCSNSATVIGRDYVSGVFCTQGSCNPALCYVSNSGDVYGRDYVSGIFSYERSSTRYLTVYYAVNSGNISGRNYVGGIRSWARHISTSAVYQCVNTGDVMGTEYVGGIIGKSQGSGYGNVNAGRVTGVRYTGGIVGFQDNYSGSSHSMHHSYSSGQVYGEEYVGSVAGYYEEGTVQSCYYDKQISGRVKGSGMTGEDVSGVAEGKLTREMLNDGIKIELNSESYFTYAPDRYPVPTTIVNYDGAKVAAMPLSMADTVTAYTIPGRADYPINSTWQESVTWLVSEGLSLYRDGTVFKASRSGGSVVTATLNGYSKNVDFMVGVSSTMPCIIKNDAQLAQFTACVNSGHEFYYNTADSTFSLTSPGNAITIVPVATGGEGGFFKLAFSPVYSVSNEWAGRIGTTASPFKGEFNGNNQTVTNLTNATTDTCGFFGYNAGRVFNLNIVNPNMGTANYSCVGAVAGYNTGKIDSCHVVNGVVKGVNYVGGVAGNNAGYVTASYSSATVAATGYVGGVTGYNSGSVASCFNLGEITGKSYTGGVVGQNTATLTNSYNAGNISGDGTSNYVGGVAGQTGANISYCYNSGNVNATGTNIGSVAGACASQTIPSLAYDNQMSIVSAFDGSNYQALSANTVDMVGNSLQSRLGTENWVYADSLYPRLKGMETSDAAVLSATPVFLSDGERVTSVEHAFRVYTYNNNVTWTTESPALDMSAVPAVSFNTCGQPVLTATRNDESKNVKLQINYTAAVVHKDTTCGEEYTWDINHVTYYASNTVVVSTIGDDGCPYTHTLEITIPTPLSVTLSSTPELCTDANNGTATVTVTGGLGDRFNYAWSSSEPRDLATANNQGRSHTVGNLSPDYTYEVTVTDAVNVTNTCTVTGSVTVTEAVPLVATLDTVSSGCYGSADGMFEVSFSGGRPGYKVTWTGAGTGTRRIDDPTNHYRVEGLDNGNYHIIVSDSNHCTKEFDISLVQDNNTYTISAFDTTKKYDGVAVNAARYILQIGSGAPDTIASGHSKTLANGDVLTATVDRTTLTDAGVYLNSVNSYQVMRGTQDVTCQYNITPRNRNIIINKRHVTFTSADTMTFHPNNAAISRVTVTGDGFVEGETVSYHVTGFRDGENPGSSDNTFTINWSTANPNNYDTTKVYGTLIVVKNGILVVRGTSLNKVYDGESVTYTPTGSESYTAVGMKVKVLGDAGYCGCPSDTIYGLGPEYRIEVVMNNNSPITVKDADTVENRVTSIRAYYNDGATDHDVTSSFERIDTTHGSLKISRRPVQLSTQGNSWVYDATSHSLPDVTMIGSFVEGEVTAAPSASASITEVGTVTNTIDYHPSTAPDVFKLSNYNITKTEGDLEVTARPLYITGVDRYVDVTGNLQYTDEFTITNLVSGHTASGLTFRAEGTDIGTYTGEFSGSLAVEDADHNNVLPNYNPIYTKGKLYINSPDKELHIVSATSSKMYSGGPITDQTYTVTFGYQPVAPLASNPFQYKLSTGDTVQITPTNTGATGITNVGSFRNDFSISFIPSAHAVNYNRITLDTGIVSVSKRDVRLISMSKTKVYDGTGVAWDSVQAGGSGFVEGEGATYSNFRNGTSYINVGTYSEANTFTYALNSGTLASNYTITQEYGDLAVTKATLTVKADDIERVYGEPNEYTYTISGYQGSDDESVVHGLDADHPSFTCTGGQFSAIGYYTITPVLTGLSADNYDFAPATGTLTVKKRSLVINAPSVTTEYDGTVHNQTTNLITGTITYDGLVDGETATATMTYSRRPGGETPMSFSNCTVLHEGSDVTGNYSISVSNESKLIITKRDLTVKVKNAEKTYDGSALVATEYEIVSGTLGTGDAIANVLYSGSQTDAGSSPSGFEQIRIVYGYEDMEESYNFTKQGGTLKVNPKAVTVVAENNSKVYGAADPNPLTDTTVTGLVAGQSATLIACTLSREPGENVGHYIITPSGDATQGNYSVSYTTGDFEITKANLTVKVDDQSKTYGATDPTNSVSFTGLVNGDEADDILSLLGINYSRVTGEAVGTYTITATGATTIANYNVTYQTGTLTIGKAELMVKADTKSKEYGTTTDPELTATISGLQNGDAEATIRTALNINLTRATGETVGDYAYTFNSPVTSLDNYTVTYDATTNHFSITRATATVTALNKSKTFDNNSETDPALEATVSGLKNGDAASVISYMLSRVAGQNVGTYTITPAGDEEQGNYNVAYVNGTFTINAAAVTVKADNMSKTYGETDPTLTATVTGLVGSDNVTYTLSRATGETAQSYTITASGETTQGNYSVTYTSGIFTINKAELTVKALDKTREYGEENPDFDTLISGFKNGETEAALRDANLLSGTVTYTCAATPASAPGTYDIVPVISELTATNYIFKTDTGTLTVTNSTKAIAISSEDKSWEFDGTEHKWEKYHVTYGGTELTAVAESDGKQFAIPGTGDILTITPAATAKITNVAESDVENAFTYELDNAARYATPTISAGNLSVTKKALTIAITKTKTYDHEKLTADYNEATVTGLVTDDYLTAGEVSTNSAVVNVYNTSTSDITTAFATIKGIANYEVTYNITLTINRATMVVNCPDAAASTKMYDGTALQPVAICTPSDNSDVRIEYSTTGTWSETAPSITNVADGPLTVNVRASNPNYDTATCNYTLTITPRPITVTAADKEFEYDGAAHVWHEVAGYGSYGLISPDTMSLTFSDASTITTVAESPVANVITGHTFTTGTASNYDVQPYVDGSLTMVYGEPIELTITARDTAWEFDATMHTFHSFTVQRGTDAAVTVPVSANGEYTFANGDKLTVTFDPNSKIADNVTGGVANTILDNYTLYHGTTDVHEAYNVHLVAGLLSITPKTVTVKAHGNTWTYDGAPHSEPGYTVTGLIPGDATLDATTSGSITFPGEESNIISTTSFTSGNSSNYIVVKDTGTLKVVAPATLPALRVVAENFEGWYDGQTHSKPDFKVYQTVNGTEELRGSATSGNGVTLANGRDIIRVTVTGSIRDYVATGVDNVPAVISIMNESTDVLSLYNVTLENGLLMLNQKPLQIQAASGTWTYDGLAHTKNSSTDYSIVNGTSLASSDVLESVTLTGSQTFEGSSDNVASAAVIKRGETNVTGNYNITYLPGTLTVNANLGAIVVTSGNYEEKYDGNSHTAQNYTVTFNGLTCSAVEGSTTQFLIPVSSTKNDTLTVTPGAVEVKHVDDGTVDNTFTCSLTNSSSYQYAPSTTYGTLKVNPREITMTSESDTKLYDGTPLTSPTVAVTGDAIINGEIYDIEATGSVTTISEGEVTNTIIFKTTSDYRAANYSITKVEGTLQITGTDDPITITSADGEWTYDGEEHSKDVYTVVFGSNTVTADATGLKFELLSGDTLRITPSASRLITNVGSIENAFTYTIDNSGAYVGTITPTAGTLTVTPAAVTVKAVDNGKVYGESDPTTLTATVTGMVHSEPESLIAYTVSRAAGENVGHYAITPSGDAVQGNYAVTYETGDFEITPKAITIKADDKTKVYDNDATTDPALTATVTGVPTSGVEPVYSLSRVAGQDVNTYTITVTAEAASNPNYTVTTETGTFSITPQAITIKADDKTKVYDNDATTDPALTATLTGVPASGVAPVYSLSREAGQDVGKYVITVTAEATANPNYTVTVEPDTFRITPQAITIKADEKTKVYDNDATTDPELTATVTGMPTSGVAPVYSLSRVAGQEVNTYTITVTAEATSNPNYTVTTETGTFSITPKAITIAADFKTKMYDNDATTDPALTATVTGVPTNGVAPEYSLSREAGQDAADYTITVTASATANPNYTVTTETNIFRITPRTGVVVTVQEHGREVEWNGSTQTVSGYSISINDPLYLESYIHFSGTALASGDGDENNLRIYYMMLSEGNFSNTNGNFTGVTFTILDSALYIYPKLKAEATTTQVFCHLGNNGTATIEVTGGKANNGKYSFAVDGGTAAEYDPTHTFTGFEAGDHYVVVTDSLNYTVRVDFEITEIAELTATIVTPSELCPNQGSYPVSVTVAGGTADYSYEWSGDATNANAASTIVNQIGANDGEQTYTVTVTVTDDHTCTATASTTFTVRPSVSKPGSITYDCANDTTIVLNYGVVDTMIILNQPTYTTHFSSPMQVELSADGLHVSNRYAVPEGRDDTTYVVTWKLTDECGADTVICTQRIKVIYPACTSTELGGVTYQAVRLGGNCWTRANLSVVPQPLSRAASLNGTYKYNNSDELFNQYGYLYTWYAACHVTENDNSAVPVVSNGHVQGICPDGWALPTADDFIIMVDAIGGVPHMKIADDNFWITGLEGTAPSSGFDALGAGYYKSSTDSFEGLMSVARFWTATPTGSSVTGTAIQCAVCEGEDVLIAPKADGYSVRCVKVQ